MKPPPFAYVDPRTIPETLASLSQYGDDCKLLAGGQSLVPLLNFRLAQPQVLIDLNRVADLQYIRAEDRDGIAGIAFGAMTRQQSIEDHALVRDRLPLLREAVSWVGHPQIRNRGTIGGSIAHADPAAELPLVFCAADGVATICGPHGERQVSAREFFVYTFSTVLEPDELLSAIWLPVPAPRTGQAFVEVARRHGDFALIAVAAILTLSENGAIIAAAIGVAGAAPTPVRALAAEQALIGQHAGLEAFRAVGELAAQAMEPTDDVHADAHYRREVAGTLTYRALKTAWERIPRGDA